MRRKPGSGGRESDQHVCQDTGLRLNSYGCLCTTSCKLAVVLATNRLNTAGYTCDL